MHSLVHQAKQVCFVVTVSLTQCAGSLIVLSIPPLPQLMGCPTLQSLFLADTNLRSVLLLALQRAACGSHVGSGVVL